jgi:hypothetical protein
MWDERRLSTCADDDVHNSCPSNDHNHHRATTSPAHDNPATSAANDRSSGELSTLDEWR